ncbi:MAG: hypothetical protein Q7J10_00460 [Methanosarcinaceae archaeon]|nr:hypothetical protein [Methanosarcinaceae archaeon]
MLQEQATSHITVVEKIKARTGMSPPIGEKISFMIIADRKSVRKPRGRFCAISTG